MAKPRRARWMTELGALRIVEPKAWAAKVRAAMKDGGGRTPDAARALGISVRQLFRWLDDPLLATVKRAPVGSHRDE